MATVKEKLSQLARPLRLIKVVVGGEEVEVYYQRPTVLKDRILREAMREQYDEAIKTFTSPKPDGSQSLRDDYMDQFKVVGKAKTIDFLLGLDLAAFSEEATKQIGKERPSQDADEEIKKVWFEEWKPTFDAILEAARQEFEKQDEALLAETAVERQLDNLARQRAFDTYRLRLIVDSLYDSDGTSKTPVFQDTNEVEELLVSDVIEELGKMISEEIRKAREIPLASVAKTSP